MQPDSKAFELFWQIYNSDEHFKEVVSTNMESGKIRFFNEEEWNKINSQNYMPRMNGVKEFIDVFTLGYNIGDCVGTSKQLSYSYNNVDIVAGTVPIFIGTLNAEKEGGHRWLETPTHIIDTSLMLVIHKSLKSEIGYVEEERITSYQLSTNHQYQMRKEFVNDPSFRKHKSV